MRAAKVLQHAACALAVPVVHATAPPDRLRLSSPGPATPLAAGVSGINIDIDDDANH